MYIASAEDLNANMLVFGSEQDLKDAEGTARENGLKYLEMICKKIGCRTNLLN